MRRTQLYLSEDVYGVLSVLSRQEHRSVSDLVREAVVERYGTKTRIDKATIAKKLAGIWKRHPAMKDPEAYLRRLRKDTRRKRFGLG
jgi:hypothetical protein